jgi:Carboxypeptidase regulatory-like domain
MFLSDGRLRLLLLFQLALSVFATPGFSSWNGTVRDAAGNPVSDAVLELRSVSGGGQYSVRTSALGSFVLPAIAAGKYQLFVSARTVNWARSNFAPSPSTCSIW